MALGVFFTRKWRIPKLMIALFVLEFPLTVAALALFGIADPDTYRTKLWQNGSDKGFNSNPNEILYSYANYRPISVPLIWSSFLTQFNVVISVLSMFFLLVKSTMFVLHTFLPALSLFVHALLVALYAVAVRNQSASDLSDPAHPSKGLPWYLSKGCSYADPGNKGYCMQARASFAVTCVMLALFTVYLLLAVWSSIPTEAEKAERNSDRQADIELKAAWKAADPDAGLTKEEKWERNRQIFLNLPKTPNTPYGGGQRLNPMTPRTTAFTQLSGGNVNGGTANSSRSGPSRPLAFREQYGGEQKVPDAR